MEDTQGCCIAGQERHKRCRPEEFGLGGFEHPWMNGMRIYELKAACGVQLCAHAIV